MREVTLRFGTEGALVGTVNLPEGKPAAIAQVLFNAGIVHRVGPHRANVRLARRLARRGIASIRFDLRGLGDSERPGAGEGYREAAMADISAAMDELGRQSGATRFVLWGFCSGGRHGHAAAVADPRVAGIVIYDAFLYPTWRTRMNRYLMSIRRKGLVGAVRDRLGRVAGRDAAEPDAQASLQGSAIVLTPAQAAEGWRALHARGTRILHVASGGFDRFYNYARQFEDTFGRYGVSSLVEHRYLPHLDHTAIRLERQDELLALVEAFTVDLVGASPTRV
jgi:pimeloyl-ACP methyl ester carboxylesterase